MLSTMLRGGLWEPLTSSDFVAPSNPAGQDLSSGTTTATVDFGAATGQQTVGTPTVTLGKPSGSAASASVAANGSGWRVSMSSLADGESYLVQLNYTAVDGQVTTACARVDVAAASGVVTWSTLVNLDLTNCTDQSGLGVEGSYTLVIGGVSVPLVVSKSTGTAGTCTATLTNGVGLVVSHLGGASAPSNRTFALDLTSVYGAGLKPDINLLMVEFTMTVDAMSTNQDSVSCEVGEANPITSNNPGYFGRLNRVSGTQYDFVVGHRATSTATTSTGQTVKASLPASTHIQLVGMQRSWRAYWRESTSVANPRTPTTQGNCGSAVVTPADSASDAWGTTTYAQVTLTGYGIAVPVGFTLKRVRVLAAQPVQ